MSSGVHRGASRDGPAALPPEPPTDPDSSRTPDVAPPKGRPPARGELVVRNGPVAGLRFALRDGLVSVGRSRQTDCPLHDEAISRRHFELEVSAGGVTLRDLGSGNGTRLNGEPVREALLHDGDRIVAGNSVIEFRVSGELAGARAGRRDGPRRRLPWKQSLAVGVPLVAGVAWLSVVALQRQHARQAAAAKAFGRALAELSEDPPDPELALSDLLSAQRDYPDRRALSDALGEAHTVVQAIQQLARARSLAEQRNFAEARHQLEGLPETPYFARMRGTIGEEIGQRETARVAAAQPPVPVIRTLPVSDHKPERRPAAVQRAQLDDARADELCDEGDALIGTNPQAAQRKYREALRHAHPGGLAARRAQSGLE